MKHVRKIASLAMAVGMVLPAGAALAYDHPFDIDDDTLDQIAPPIPVTRPAEPEAQAEQQAVAETIDQGSDVIAQYIETDEDGTPDFDEDRARADGVDPALIEAAEAVEERIDDAEEADAIPVEAKRDGEPMIYHFPEGCVPVIGGKPVTEYFPSLKIEGSEDDCKPQVQASSSKRIDKDPVINGIKYSGYHMTTHSRYVASAICAFYSWSIVHERTEEIWVLSDYFTPDQIDHPVLELDT